MRLYNWQQTNTTVVWLATDKYYRSVAIQLATDKLYYSSASYTTGNKYYSHAAIQLATNTTVVVVQLATDKYYRSASIQLATDKYYRSAAYTTCNRQILQYPVVQLHNWQQTNTTVVQLYNWQQTSTTEVQLTQLATNTSSAAYTTGNRQMLYYSSAAIQLATLQILQQCSLHNWQQINTTLNRSASSQLTTDKSYSSAATQNIRC